METLRTFLSGFTSSEQSAFAIKAGTSIGYLRKALSVGQRLGESICIGIERESFGAVRCEDLRPDVDWAYLRGTVAVDAEKTAKTETPKEAA